MAHQSINLYEIDHYILTYSKEFAGKIIVRTSSGKTTSIKGDKKRKAVSILDEVERRSAIPRCMTYLVHRGKVLKEKRRIEENNIGTATTIDTSLRLLGGMKKSELVDTLESGEDRGKGSWRKRVKVN